MNKSKHIELWVGELHEVSYMDYHISMITSCCVFYGIDFLCWGLAEVC